MLFRLFVLFVTFPLIELILLLMIGQRIGMGATLAVILLTGILGVFLARTQGLKALARYQEAIQQGKIPHEAIIDSLLILVAGVLLVIPSFLADGLGVLLLLPPVRALIRGYLKQSIREKITVAQRDLGRPVKHGPDVDTASPVITVEAEVVETSTDRTHRDHP